MGEKEKKGVGCSNVVCMFLVRGRVDIEADDALLRLVHYVVIY